MFQPDDLEGLPAPGRRFLSGALRPEAALTRLVRLEMEGEIKVKDWVPFRARQVLRAGEGFVWEASAGRPPVVLKGGDSYWKGQGSLDFRLWGLVPVVRAGGRDVDRSSAGRLAAETVVWAPQTLLPSMGTRWTTVDATTAVVHVPIGDRNIDVTVTIDGQGQLRQLTMLRWGDPEAGNFDLYPFGGGVDDRAEFGGITIATRGAVGWWWGTERQAEGEFFRYRITDARVG